MNEAIAMCVAFTGVIVISTAKQAPAPDASIDGAVETESNSGEFLFGVLMAIVGALTFAAQSVIVRKMSKLNAFTITFWYTMCCSLTLLTASVIESCVKKQKWGPIAMNWQCTVGCISLGALFFTAMQSNTIANQNDKSGFVTLIGYLGCCYALLGDIFIFHEKFTTQQLIGMVVIFGVMIYLGSITIYNSIQESKAAAEEKKRIEAGKEP